MTFLEKWKLEHPGNDDVDFPMSCPSDYEYESINDQLGCTTICYMPASLSCHDCWRREIPMKEKESNCNTERNIPSRYGYWQVSTEGDEEGKSIRNLGVYHGNIDEIAFALADQVWWSLDFKQINPDDIPAPKNYKTRINICLDLKDVPYSDYEKRIKIMQQMLSGTNISVEKGNAFGNVAIIRQEDPDRIKEAKIKTVLNKLTDEEKELLRNYFDPSLD